jgi:cytochrome b561
LHLPETAITMAPPQPPTQPQTQASAASSARYNRVARALHWSIGLLILFNLFTGLFGESFAQAANLEQADIAMPLHKATGLIILALSLVRLGWRMANPPPPYPGDLQPALQRFAVFTHGAFYGLMIAVPASGWMFSSAEKWPLSIYGLFDWPRLALTKAMPIVDAASTAHMILGYGFGALVVLHVSAALFHHYELKDTMLLRML